MEEAVASMLIRSQGNSTPVGLANLVRSLERAYVDFSGDDRDDDEESSDEGDGDSMEEEMDEEMLIDNDNSAGPEQNHAAMAAGTTGRALVAARGA